MTFNQLCSRIDTAYNDRRESKAIAVMLLEECFSMSMADALCGGVEQLGGEAAERLEQMTCRLESGEPVQYVLGWADFCGRRFRVGSGVLIPRPETEELCRWIISDWSHDTSPEGIEQPKKVLDIGTGSGCIAVTLAKDMAGADVYAWDISDHAARQALLNAIEHEARVLVERKDILNTKSDSRMWDVIVSNPPYICNKERAEMSRNVLEHEPHLALFGPDDDPLLFYKAIAGFAKGHLAPDGSLYLEINEAFANETAAMLRQEGFGDVIIRNDIYGKARMIRAERKTHEETTD